jgi:hypothetical protein
MLPSVFGFSPATFAVSCLTLFATLTAGQLSINNLYVIDWIHVGCGLLCDVQVPMSSSVRQLWLPGVEVLVRIDSRVVLAFL